MSVEESLREHIAKEYLPQGEGASLRPETPLIESGILDSMALTRLVVHVEKEYGIRVEAREITENAFGSIKKLTAFIATKKPA